MVLRMFFRFSTVSASDDVVNDGDFMVCWALISAAKSNSSPIEIMQTKLNVFFFMCNLSQSPGNKALMFVGG
jgi:hypothetical protein